MSNKKLSNEELNAIQKDAAETWENDKEKAAAAHLYGANVVRRCGGVPAFADAKQLKNVVEELEADEAAKKKAADEAAKKAKEEKK